MMDDLRRRLADRTADLDRSGSWPREQLAWLADAGILGCVIPREFGGSDVSDVELLQGYDQLAAACLTTTFVLTQRNGACQRIAGSDNQELKSRLLPDLAIGKSFATVGISHLTTSRQHLHMPAVQAEFSGDTIRLKGIIPWVTGAEYAQHIITGGTLPDGRQILVALPATAAGVTVLPHAELLALTASFTASVELRDVVVSAEELIAGPVAGVMKQGGRGGTGSLGTSSLALGLATRAIQMIEQQAHLRDDLCGVAGDFREEECSLRADLYQAAEHGDGGQLRLSSSAIRQRANSLALRATQAALAVSKGAGFVKGHPAELAVREAMFFLVWSCPQPVVQGVLEELTCREGLGS